MSCFGAIHVMCHSFGAFFAATLFQSQKAAEAAALQANCAYNCGQTQVWVAGTIKGFEGSSGNESLSRCEDLGDPPGNPDAPGANDGETNKPGKKSGPDPAPSV